MFARGIGQAEATKLLPRLLHRAMPAPASAALPSCPALAPLPAAPLDAPLPSFPPPAGFQHSASWCYRNEAGLPVYIVVRYDKPGGSDKTYRPYHWDGGWIAGDPKGKLPVYHLDQLAARPEAPVLVCEGEKAADAAQRLLPGYVCITSPHGANSASKADWSEMAGREVVDCPDHDEAGRSYAQDVAKLAYGAGAAKFSIVEIPAQFPPKWDLADPLPKGANLKALVKAAVLVERPKTLADHVISLGDFMAQPTKPRDYLVFPWLAASSLNMVFAARGLGKSWFVHHLALCLAAGAKFFAWAVPQKYRVLIVDGEMQTAALQKRFRILAGKALPPGLDILPSESLWLAGSPLNLNDTGTQVRVEQMLDSRAAGGMKPDLIIFDNLSSLTAGLDENDNGALDGLLQWLMRLRHQGYAVLLVHHSGKGGDQRGASRREDLLDTSIKLDEAKNLPEPPRGACFEIKFSKTRDERPTPDKLTVALVVDNSGQAVWQVIEAMSDEVKILRTIHDHAPKSQNNLASLLGIASTTAGKKLGPLFERKLVEKAPNLISLTSAGIALLDGASHATAQISRKYAGTPKGGAK